MARTAKHIFILVAALAGCAGGGVAGATTMGSLAPHDPTTTSAVQQQWIVDPHTNCRAQDSDFDPDDSISWQGACVAGLVSGPGTLTYLNKGHIIETLTGTFDSGALQPGRVSAVWADGSKYEGEQSGGEFDGPGLFVSAAGDRFEGQWKDGKPEGRVAQATTGARDNAPASAAQASAESSAPASSIATETPDTVAETGNNFAAFHALVGKTLVAVDGSTVDLNATESGLTRVITLPNGTEQRTSFALMNDRIGTVSNETTATGLFRMNADEIDVDYADGQVETFKPNTAGSLMLSARAADGTSTCSVWYPENHVFSQDEKRAAVLEYASRLGVASPDPLKKRHGAHSAPPVCGGAVFATGTTPASAAAAGATRSGLPTASPLTAKSAAELNPTPPAEAAGVLQPVPVKDSMVHLIDTPYDSQVPQPHVEQAKFTADASAAVPPAAQETSPSVHVSDCLSVGSDGDYLGFQNRCAKSLQFVYCEMGDGNPLTSCQHTAVPGSVAPNGFSPLVGNLGKHDFRWMACEGGAGEVVAHLDSVDPPVGRCVRSAPIAEK